MQIHTPCRSILGPRFTAAAALCVDVVMVYDTLVLPYMHVQCVLCRILTSCSIGAEYNMTCDIQQYCSWVVCCIIHDTITTQTFTDMRRVSRAMKHVS